jgi:hypothetical protein
MKRRSELMIARAKNIGRYDHLKNTLCLMLVVLSFFALPLSANAEQNPATRISLADFTRAYELKTTLEGAIYKATLPKFVYEGLIQSQQRDLAVFNADGHIVPFAIREAAPVYRVSKESSEYRVPFYELPPESRTENVAGPIDVYVKTDAGGSVVSVKSGGGRSETRDRSYLLDFSSIAYNHEIVSRELRLTLPDMKLSAKISVYESSNLQSWRPLLTDAPLLQLVNENTRFSSDSVELPRSPERYVELRIRDVDSAFELRGVSYVVTIGKQSSYIMEESVSIDGTTAFTNDKSNSAIEYYTIGAFPISKVNFILQEPGFYRVVYFSRPEIRSEWRTRGKMELSMIRSQDNSLVLNEPTPINVREERYWRIEFEGAFHGTLPKMEMSWRQSDVYFLAQGRAPYYLAFGSHLEELSLQNIVFLRGRDTSAMEAEFGEVFKERESNISTPIGITPDWQRYLVWGLLVLGALLLSGIAWKLIKSR